MLAAAWSPASGAYAQATPGLIVVPRGASGAARSYFKLRASRGATALAGTIQLRNPTAAPLRVALNPVDGQTLATLGSAYAPPGSKPHGATRWLIVPRASARLSPGQSVSVPISVTVPRAAQPGDYLAGVSVEALDQKTHNQARGGVSIASAERYVIGVETVLGGARHPMIRFTGAEVRREPAGLTFLLDARNSGNVILQGVHGAVRVTRAGRVVLSRALEAGTFVSATQIAYPVPAFGQAPAQGTRYDVSAWLRYPGGIARLNTTVVFGRRQALEQRRYSAAPRGAGGGTAPWKIALVFAVVLYALATTILLLRRRARPAGG